MIHSKTPELYFHLLLASRAWLLSESCLFGEDLSKQHLTASTEPLHDCTRRKVRFGIPKIWAMCRGKWEKKDNREEIPLPSCSHNSPDLNIFVLLLHGCLQSLHSALKEISEAPINPPPSKSPERGCCHLSSSPPANQTLQPCVPPYVNKMDNKDTEKCYFLYFFPSWFTQLLWNNMTAGLTNTSHVLAGSSSKGWRRVASPPHPSCNELPAWAWGRGTLGSSCAPKHFRVADLNSPWVQMDVSGCSDAPQASTFSTSQAGLIGIYGSWALASGCH